VKRRVRGVLVITEVYSNGWIVDGLSRVLLTFSILSAYAQVDRGTTWKRPHADLKLSLVSDWLDPAFELRTFEPYTQSPRTHCYAPADLAFCRALRNSWKRTVRNDLQVKGKACCIVIACPGFLQRRAVQRKLYECYTQSC
jgi:hypothetical protein